MQCIVCLNSLIVILGRHCVAIMLAEMLIWAHLSYNRCVPTILSKKEIKRDKGNTLKLVKLCYQAVFTILSV